MIKMFPIVHMYRLHKAVYVKALLIVGFDDRF